MLTDRISIGIEVFSRADPVAGRRAFERICGREEVIGIKLEF